MRVSVSLYFFYNSRKIFEELCKDLIDRIAAPILQAIAESGKYSFIYIYLHLKIIRKRTLGRLIFPNTVFLEKLQLYIFILSTFILAIFLPYMSNLLW